MKIIFKKIVAYILEIESRLVLWKYKPKIVAITGSVGKTSTKDAVYAVISDISYVRKSEKSYNSEIGLPLTVLGIPNGWNNPIIWLKNIFKGLWLFLAPHKYPKWLVLEVGVGKPRDMRKTASWLKTDAVIITAIGETPAHIEFFDSRKHLIEEKSELIQTLKKDGILVLNADDEAVLALKTKSKNRIVTFGCQNEADAICSGESISYDSLGAPTGIIFRIDAGGNSLPVVIEGVFGKNHIYASLAALALSFGLKWNMINAVNTLKHYDVSPGRMRLLQGINNSLIIDDTYNSSPFACEFALKTLNEIKSDGRKIAILGDMLELGRHTKEAHKNIGRIAKENVDILVVVGQRAKDIKEGAIESGFKPEDIFEFSHSVEAGEHMKNMIKKNDTILIKGSQGLRMERAVLALMIHPEDKEKLLVRQDKEWQKR
jgi:UDP-N-acetylmuramoyl-tripeptide--D-alanyl-D-alanine ligase